MPNPDIQAQAMRQDMLQAAGTSPTAAATTPSTHLPMLLSMALTPSSSAAPPRPPVSLRTAGCSALRSRLPTLLGAPPAIRYACDARKYHLETLNVGLNSARRVLLFAQHVSRLAMTLWQTERNNVTV
jgi:hypothetical protein